MTELDLKSTEALRILTETAIIRRDSLGDQNFGAISEKTIELRDIFLKIHDILNGNPTLNDGFRTKYNGLVSDFRVSLIEPILNYDLKADAPNNFANQNTLIKNINRYYNNTFNFENHIFQLLNSLQILNVLNADKLTGKLQDEYIEKNNQMDTLLKELRKKAGSITVSDYAKIFEAQAIRQSAIAIRYWRPKLFKWNLCIPYIYLAAAERWFLIAVGVVASSLYYVPKLLASIKTEYQYPEDVLSITFQRIFYFSLMFFGLRYAFKQYSVHKHLYTVNKQRQNALESILLFTGSISEGAIDIKNALLLEAAKAIFSQGETGFLSEKSSESGSMNVVELTRLMGKKTD